MKAKVLIAALLLMAGVQMARAQKVVIYLSDNQTYECDISELDSITFSEESVPEAQWVDLGLPSGTLWATCNIGAESPEDYGYYFAWGETEPKDNYTWGTYKWMTEGKDDWNFISKYTFADNQTSGCWYSGGTFVGDGKQDLDPEDDAATAILGSGWQMPSVEQIYELINNSYTKSEWTIQRGVYGRRVTSLSNGNSIFLPAAGWRTGTSTAGSGSTGYYWSNSLGGLSADYAFPLYFLEDYWGVEHHDRFYGHPIRPVHERQAKLVARILLNRKEATLQIGKKLYLWAFVEPSDADNKTLVWESSNTSVATVGSDGIVTALAVGTATITCRATDGSGAKNTCTVTVEEQPVEPEHEYVDLGLPSGTLWATCNVGASSPEECGDYFCWGETEPKSEYGFKNYKFSQNSKLTKYCTESIYGEQGNVDGKLFLDPEDDAATVNWGSEWQIPTYEQQVELRTYTTITWTTLNDVKGMLLTSKRNGNTLFLPAAGGMYDTTLRYEGSKGYYWTNRVAINMSGNSFYLSFNTSTTQDEWETSEWDGGGRNYGYSVRPVRVKEEVHEYVDLGLPSGTLWATCNVGARGMSEFGDYFAWGETEPKDEYTWDTYKYGSGENAITKYCDDNKTELDPEDDAATVNWGNEWQMPSREQIVELVNEEYTTTTWTTKEGFYGRLITSKVNGKSIFLPAAGAWRGEEGVINARNGGYCWSRSLLKSSSSTNSHILTFSSEVFDWWSIPRNLGLSVRPVRVKKVSKEYVDLGLPSGTMWATSNVGAFSPEDAGDRFAWGETQPKDDYAWDTYKYGTENALTKYNSKGEYGDIDGRLELRAKDDAAADNWGGEWQMPSSEQFLELMNAQYTQTEQTTVNGVTCMKITSRTNGNYILMPVPDSSDIEGDANTYGFYWSRTLNLNPSCAGMMALSSTNWLGFFDDRCNGHYVRPVRKQEVVHEWVDLGLPSHTQWATMNLGATCPEEFGDYYAWGETKWKDRYSWDNYSYGRGTNEYGFGIVLKYCQDSNYGYNGYTDNRTELEHADDAAAINWSDDYWQMPSQEQFSELINSTYTTTELTTRKGIEGLLITSKSNGMSIFLPAAGNIIDNNHNVGGGANYGFYWSRSLDKNHPYSSYVLIFSANSVGMNSYDRSFGLSVRPVRLTIN